MKKCIIGLICLDLLVSCKINSPNTALFSGDFIPPKLTRVEVLSKESLLLSFDKLPYTSPLPPLISDVKAVDTSKVCNNTDGTARASFFLHSSFH